VKARELESLGIPRGRPMQAAKALCARAAGAGLTRHDLRVLITAALADPAAYSRHELAADLAYALAVERAAANTFQPRPSGPARWKQWGTGLEPESVNQLARACELPVAVAGALMPDAHVGYGLPIGGVLATDKGVVPYAVGVDIACRVRLSVLDLPPSTLTDKRGRDRLRDAIESETRFGIGASFKKPREHGVLDDDWSVSPVTRSNRDKARAQLGTSGSGNHFVEFGTLTISERDIARREGAPIESHRENGAGQGSDLGSGHGSGHGSGWSFNLPPGEYLALLSHSGSRGTGAAVCDHYSRVAMDLHPELPKELKYLAWLDLDSQAGQEYWRAMNLMGRYASANHECIHHHVIRALGARAIAHVENHHNFAWLERHDPGDGRGARDLIVHRKGATPAGAGVLGFIPGSMAAPGFLVRGLGHPDSLLSASHGAGRVMSRTKARQSFAWGNVKRDLDRLGIEVISAGLDEVPGVYKDIHAVMAAQADLVVPIGRFDPKLVKMAPPGERAED
jgi:tRNA-splicing ligase RtcB